MEYLDINSIRPVLSGPIALRNYMNDLKYLEKVQTIKEKLEIGRELHSIEFARKLKDYRITADVKNAEYSELKRMDFPFIACCKNLKKEELFFLVYDITDDGIVTKDENLEEKIIGVIDFKEIFNERIITIENNIEFIKKYSYSKEMHRLEIIECIAGGSAMIGLGILEALRDRDLEKDSKNNSKLTLIVVLSLLGIIGILFVIFIIFNAIYNVKRRKLDIKMLELEIDNTEFKYDTRRKNKR